MIEFGLFDEKSIDIIAFIFGIIYTLVPIAFFYQYTHKVIPKDRTSILGILCLFLNGLTYFVATLLNGLQDTPRQVILRDFTNLSGAILGFGYCLFYIYVMLWKEQKMKAIFYFCFMLIISLLMILLGIALTDGGNIIEYIGVVFNIFEYLPLGFDLFYLIKNRISDKFTLFSAIPGIINAIIWLIWACINVAGSNSGQIEQGKKYHSLVANLLGFLLCLTQFIIFFLGKKEDYLTDPLISGEEIPTPKDQEEEENKPKIVKKSEYDDIL